MLVSQVLRSVIIKVVNVLLVMASSVLCARLMGVAEFGRYTEVMAVIALLGAITQVGLPSLIVREVARYSQESDWSVIKGLIRWSAKVALSVQVIILALFVSFALYMALNEASVSLSLWASSYLSIGLLVMVSLASAFARGLSAVLLGQIPEKIIIQAIFILLVISFNFTGGLTGEKGVFSYFLSCVGAWVVAVCIIGRVSPHGLRKSTISNQCDKRRWAKALAPFAFIAIVQALNAQSAIIILGWLRDEKAVGLFRAAEQSAGLVAFILTSAAVVAEPYFSKMWRNRDLIGLVDRLDVVTRLGILFALPIAATLYYGANWVLMSLFGSAYTTASDAMQILVLGQIFNVVVGPVGVLLNMTGHERVMMTAVAISVIAGIVAALLVIPFYGYLGAAIASTIAMMVWNLYAAIGLYLQTGIKVTAWRMLIRR